MKVKFLVIGLTIIGSIAVGFVLLTTWLSLGGCPPSYWVSVFNIAETTSPTTNITRNDLPPNSVLQSILIELIENSSLNDIDRELPFSDWNATKSMLENSNIVPSAESYPGRWVGIVYFENELIQIELNTIVC